jgi:hypothetical protein
MQSIKAFISYSHNDTAMLDMLHKHLAQLRREGLINTWEDRAIDAGGVLDQQISSALTKSTLFLALLSPDYIASNYCYEKEFQTALQLQETGKLIIVPIVIEPCDWLSTPFNKFKAIPKDGKAITTWENKNTAFLDVTQNIRRLIKASEEIPIRSQTDLTGMSRNYRVKKDFDTIDKLEFVQASFSELKDMLHRYMGEIDRLDNIKVRVLQEDNKNFKALLVNRNKTSTESELLISIDANSNSMSGFFRSNEHQINYTINGGNQSQKGYKLSFDEFQLFWEKNSFYSSGNEKFSSKDIADTIWNEWLESVGIL